MRSHLTRLLAATGLFAVLAPTTAVASSAATDGTPEDSPSAVAVAALLKEPAPVAAEAIPAEFESVMGYQPQIRRGRLVDPHGGCSGPIPLPQAFSLGCAEHDLGYDLLRYADLAGDPVGGWARSAIDDQLDDRMHSACAQRSQAPDRAACSAAARIATAGVELNSIRQFQEGPEETAGSLAVTGLAGAAGAAALGAVAVTIRGRRPGARRPRLLEAAEGVTA